jgi:filamentous hemagglutinin family protein
MAFSVIIMARVIDSNHRHQGERTVSKIAVIGWLGLLGIGAIALSSTPLNAQIIPDETLGTESSRVRSRQVQGRLTERIEGGAIRNENLFHSFREFNIRNGDRVYFANPRGIENIFGRITGFEASHIRGTLGVNGNANLFLMNPNGVVFGRNAQLDINGSLTVTTADRIDFGNNQFFSAFNPEPPPLLTISVPLGLQYEMGRGLAAPIQSQATLVTGEDLTLDAGFLDLSGRIRAGGDLTLQAHSILQIENAPRQRFVATSGGNLVLQGDGAINILTSAQADPPRFHSGGDLLLLSDGVVTTNAQFRSIGDFGIQTVNGEPGTWINQQNAVVNVDGNYTIGDYRGPSLQVNSGGDIRYGRVVIDALDPAVNPEYPVFALNAGGDIRGRGTVSAAEELPGLIISLVSQGDIDTQRIHTRGGLISLVSPEGNISIRGDLNTGSITTIFRSAHDEGQAVPEEYVAGAIALFAGETIDLREYDLNARTSSERETAEDGGTVSLYAGQDINASRSNLLTSSDSDFAVFIHSNREGTRDRRTGDSNDAGAISIYAGRNIDLSNADLRAVSRADLGEMGDGASISIYAERDINAQNLDIRSSSSSNAGRGASEGGNISFYAGTEIDLSSSYAGSYSSTWRGSSDDGGNVTVYAGGDITAVKWRIFASSGTFPGVGVSGDGGDIFIYAEGNITIPDSTLSSRSGPYSGGGSGEGGAISIYAGGHIEASDSYLTSSTFAWGEHTLIGNGGAISLHAEGNINAPGLIVNSEAYARNDGSNGGAISLYAGANIDGDMRLNSLSYARFGNSGNGGDISILAPNGYIDGLERGINLYSFSIGENEPSLILEDTGRSGDIYLEARERIENVEILTAASFGRAGDVHVTGSSNLLLRNVNILTSQQIQIEAGHFGDKPQRVFIGENSQSGDVFIHSAGRLSLIDSYLESNSRSQNRAGDILLDSPVQITLRNTDIFSNTIAMGNAGNINVSTGQLNLLNSNIRAESNPENLLRREIPGSAGRITVYADDVNLNTSTISVSAQDTAQAGSLNITANTLTLQNHSRITAETENGNRQTGDITIRVDDDLTLTNQSLISTQSQNAPAGDIQITVGNIFSATDSGLTTSAQAASGGNITLRASHIRLFGDSDITTNSGIDGGNITLRANSIIAFDDSDILAFAQQQGGNIRLNTPIFFGNGFSAASLSADPEAVELNGNDRVDINATGAVSGIVALPDLSFMQNNLIELTENPLNTDALLAGSCVTRTANSSVFLITGSGGLPDRPGDAPPSSYPTGTIRTIPENDRSDVSTEANRWELGDQIAEPQGLYQLSDGRIILSQECTFE